MPEMATATPTVTNGDAGLKTDGDALNNNVEAERDSSADSDLARAFTAGTSEWIDAALVAEACGEDPASISDVQVKGAVAAGDNYCSCMWRVRARAGDRPLSLIVKAPPRGELMQDFVSKLGCFSKESKMLSVSAGSRWVSREQGYDLSRSAHAPD